MVAYLLHTVAHSKALDQLHHPPYLPTYLHSQVILNTMFEMDQSKYDRACPPAFQSAEYVCQQGQLDLVIDPSSTTTTAAAVEGVSTSHHHSSSVVAAAAAAAADDDDGAGNRPPLVLTRDESTASSASSSTVQQQSAIDASVAKVLSLLYPAGR